MEMLDQFIHVKATCSFCASRTEITATGIDARQAVLCGVCGNELGTIADLSDKGSDRHFAVLPAAANGRLLDPAK